MEYRNLIFTLFLTIFVISGCSGGGGGGGSVTVATDTDTDTDADADDVDGVGGSSGPSEQEALTVYCNTAVDEAETKNLENIKNDSEYKFSGDGADWAPLDNMCASFALLRIPTAVAYTPDANDRAYGENVTVAIVDSLFDTSHAELADSASGTHYYAGENVSGDRKTVGVGCDLVSSNTDAKACTDGAQYEGTDVAALIAAKKHADGEEGMYGLAHKSTLRLIAVDNGVQNTDGALGTEGALAMSRALRASVFDINTATDAERGSVANMTEAFGTGKNLGVSAVQIRAIGGGDYQRGYACTDDGKFFERGLGKVKRNVGGSSCGGATNTANLDGNEIDAIKILIGSARTSNLNAGTYAQTDAVVVVGTGDDGMNSETGMMTVYESKAAAIAKADGTGTQVSAKDALGQAHANVAGFYASIPVLDPSTGNDWTRDWAQAGAVYNQLGSAELGAAVSGVKDYQRLTQARWLAVVALDKDNTIASFSNGCGLAARFCLAAPGVDIRSATADGGYKVSSGTDAAAAFVTGALATLKGQHPTMSAEALQDLLLTTADYIASDDEGALATNEKDSCVTNAGYQTFEALSQLAALNCLGGDKTYNQVYGHGIVNLRRATQPSGDTYAVGFNNVPLGALIKDTQINLANHFGSDVQNVKLGMKDYFERTFTTSAAQTMYQPIGVGLDDYMSGLLGSNQQTETLGPQAQANYSNNGTQNWMNFEYRAGKSTAKVGFQDAYKVNPLQDSSTSILRANNIRPASTNIGMMDVDYEINGNISLSSYAARGEYDTGFKFDELGTDLDMRHNKSTLNLGIGHLREHDQFLGTNTTGAYAISAPSVSRFTDVTYGHDLGNTGKFNIYANYINYETEVDTVYDQFATIDGLQADQYQIGVKSTGILTADDGLDIALITKLGVTDGALNQNTVNGYTSAGEYNNVTQSYDLALQERHQQLEVTYQGKLYQNADKVSALSNNRFFTTLKIDRNLNNTQGLSQTEIITGMQAQF